MEKVTKELFEIIKKYHLPCSMKGNINNDAKEALLEFREKLRLIKPESCYNQNKMKRNFDYLHYLIPIRSALINQQYIAACHELGSLIYRYTVTELHMKMLILQLLDEYV
ncbi:hypothetical protein [Acetobacterium malicum]|uniref:hypothetical protein n=1 Tax=Acetobacterium malicum TaxID=52692 RepID=UPI0004024EC1|nr:hypothetical protein [Acetobacterium dehalogenans]